MMPLSAAVGLFLLALSGGGCAHLTPLTDSSPLRATHNSMSDSSLQITQGTTATRGDSRLGFVDSDGPQAVKLDVWTEQDKAWLTHWRLHVDQVFPAGDGFLQVRGIQRSGSRAVVSLAPAEAADGIVAPAADQPILPMGGSLDMGLMRIELTDPPANGTARARLWPKLRPLGTTADEDVRLVELGPGMTLDVGTRSLRVERIQMETGDIAAFVAFSTHP